MNDTARVATPPAAVWAAIYIGVAAATLPAVLPVIIGVFADHFGYGIAEAGMIASLNMGGILVGSLLCPVIAARLSWSVAARCGLGVMIAGNLLTMLDGSYAYIAATRVFSGLGEGVVAGICYAAMGRSAWPERAVSLYFAGQSILGIIGLGSFGWIAATFGWQWLFVALSLVAVPGFWLAPVIGTAQQAGPVSESALRVPGNRLAIGALGFVLIYFIGMASLWPFLERIGVGKGFDAGSVAFALSASAFGGLAGSLAAGAVADRLSRRAGLFIGTVILVCGIAGLGLPLGPVGFAIAISLFAFAWPFQYAFQFGLLASADRSGRIVTLTPAITGGGLVVGPAVGGLFLQYLGLGTVAAFCVACVAISVAGALYINRKAGR